MIEDPKEGLVELFIVRIDTRSAYYNNNSDLVYKPEFFNIYYNARESRKPFFNKNPDEIGVFAKPPLWIDKEEMFDSYSEAYQYVIKRSL